MKYVQPDKKQSETSTVKRESSTNASQLFPQNKILQLQKTIGNQATIQLLTQKNVIQRYPKPGKNENEYYDSIYTDVILTKIRTGIFQLSDGTIVSWDGAYYDENGENEIDISAYSSGATSENAGGESYNYSPGELTGEVMSISEVEAMVSLRGDIEEEKETEKSSSYSEAMLRGDVFPPIIITRWGDGSFSLSQGNHRIMAAKKAGFTKIPVNFVYQT